MLSAFAALNRGAEVGHVRGWLHAILRHAGTRARGPAEAPLELAMQTGEAPDAMFEARADARLVLLALDELPTRQREALVGSSVQGLSRAELATTLGVSEGAVRQLVHRARSAVRAAVTSMTPYPVIRWLTGAGGSASAGPPELALASGAAGAGGVAAKLGMVAAAGAIAASGFAAPGHHATRAGDRVHVTRGPSTTVTAVTAMRSGPPAPASGGQLVTAPARGTGRAGDFTSLGDGSGRGQTGGPARGGQPESTRGDEGSRGADATGRRPSSTSNSGSGPDPAPGTSESSPNGSREHSGSGGGGSRVGGGGSSSGDGGPVGRGQGDTTTTPAPGVSTPAATTASDGGGDPGHGGSNNRGGSGTSTQTSGAGADGSRATETSTTSSESRDLLPPAGSSLPTDH